MVDMERQLENAWTIDRDIAEKFANGAATRQANRGGVIYQATVDRSRILGYLTGRGESEVIVDPKDVYDV